MFEANILPLDLKEIVNNEMDRGERLLWTGQPKSSRFLLLSLPLVLFAIPLTAFAIFWIFAASGFGKKMPDSLIEWLFPLFGLPFVLIGLGMLSAPFWIKRRAKKTVYAVTNKRVIIFAKGFSVKVMSYDNKKLNNITKRIKADGSGDLLFNEVGCIGSNGNHRSRMIGFWGISDVNMVEDLIESTRQES